MLLRVLALQTSGRYYQDPIALPGSRNRTMKSSLPAPAFLLSVLLALSAPVPLLASEHASPEEKFQRIREIGDEISTRYRSWHPSQGYMDNFDLREERRRLIDELVRDGHLLRRTLVRDMPSSADHVFEPFEELCMNLIETHGAFLSCSAASKPDENGLYRYTFRFSLHPEAARALEARLKKMGYRRLDD